MKNLVLILNLFIVTSLVTAQVNKSNIKELGNSSISGRIFNDINNNGVYNSGIDFPQSTGWSVQIQGPVNQSVTPSLDGTYSFTNLPAGTYTVSEIVPQDWTVISPYWNGTYTINLISGMNESNKDFANFCLLRNNSDLEYLTFPNGQNTGDNTAPAMSSNNPHQSGFLSFDALPPNSIHLSVSSAGFSPNIFHIKKNQIVQLAISSIDDGVHVLATNNSKLSAIAILVGPGQTKLITFKAYNLLAHDTIEFTCVSPDHAARGEVVKMVVDANTASISGKIYNDLNNNGVFDTGTDLPQSTGWSVQIQGPVNQTAIPSADGTYSFTNLPVGIYTVSEIVPPDWTVLSPYWNGTYTLDLSAGGNIINKDFANFYLKRDNSNYEYLTFPNGLNIGDNTVVPSISTAPKESAPLLLNDLPVNSIHLNVGSNKFSPDTLYVKKDYVVQFALTSTDDYTHVFMFDDPKMIGTTLGVAGHETRMKFYKTYNVSVGDKLNFHSDIPGETEKGCMIIVENIGSISGKIFNDINNNGAYDSGIDLPQSTGWSVKITGPVNRTIIPNSDGTYLFQNLPGGTYTVSEIVPDNWTVLSPYWGGTYTIDLTTGGNVFNKDFANFYLIRDNSDTEYLRFPNGQMTGDNTVLQSSQFAPLRSGPIDVNNLPVNVVHIYVNNAGFQPNPFYVAKNQIVQLALTSTDQWAHGIQFDDAKIQGVGLGVYAYETRVVTFKTNNFTYGEQLNFHCLIPSHKISGSMIIKSDIPTASIDINKSKSNIDFFPNPIKESFQITGFSGKALLKLIDINGKVLLTKHVTENERIILSTLPKGLYLFRLITSDNVTESKLIKE